MHWQTDRADFVHSQEHSSISIELIWLILVVIVVTVVVV